ncbi:hypothetical protein HS7_17250 [Sulfolobales archaeon HS-7]|nr:hypothetical protein HS7_17250 [Sulfolobales archaeon HS-7]
MKVLFLRPDPSFSYQGYNDITSVNLSIITPYCIPHEEPIEMFDGVVFFSINAVKCFKGLEKIVSKKVFAIGETTATALKSNRIKAEYPEDFTSSSLARLLLLSDVKSVIAFRSMKANDILKKALTGKIRYREEYNYDVKLNEGELEKARKILRNCEVDVVVLTSEMIASLVKDSLSSCVKVVSIGPVTSRALGELSYIEAKRHDITGVDEVLKELSRNGR